MRRKKINLKGIVCALMSSAMILTLVTPASAATARATTMKLEKTEGTVTLKTQNGSARKITTGMRLYNGNTLETAKYSYAHISLDSTKAVKLDQSSSATLRQSGKQLELLVKSGKLFFNVNKKLNEKESMNVRTSTMVTGIRGTCGVVEYVDVNKSKLYLIEGKVTLGSGNNATTVYGGQTATVVLQPKQETGGSEQPGGEDKPGEPEKEMEQKVMVETLTEKQIPPVALQEIVADPVLQEKIEETTKLKIEKIEEALEQFEKEEAERIEQEKAEQEKEEEKEEEEEKEQAEKKEDESTSSSGGGSYTPSTPAPTTATLSGTVSAAAINAALASYNKVTVAEIGTDTAGNIVETNVTLEADVSVPAGKVLIMETGVNSGSGKISVGSGTLIDTVGKASDVISDSSVRLCVVDDTSVYASEFNTQVAGYISELAQKPATVTVNFQKPAVVKSNITLQPVSASNPMELNMGSNTLEILTGTLTLASNVSITSSSSNATVLLSGGNLALQGTSTNANTVIENTGGGTTIKRTAGNVTWNDTGLSVVNTSGVAYTITDATVDASGGTVTLSSSWVSVKSGCVPIWDSNGKKITLKSVQSEFTSGAVTAAELNQALSVHTTVTVGSNAMAQLSSGDTVTVPAGKTLRIQSQVTSSGDSSDQSYSNGVDLNQGTITLKDNASLYVSGYVWGTGTINAGDTKGAEVLVTDGGTLSASQLNLTKGSSIINSGTIDTGTITTDGTETIQNYALIKTQKYKHLADTSGTGKYSGVPNSLLVNNLDLSGLLSGVSLLSYANVSETATAGLQYFYTDGMLGTKMAERINTIKTHSGVDELEKAGEVWWHFEKDALVPSGTDITLTDFNAVLGTHTIQVAGALTLQNDTCGTIRGNGTSLFNMNGGTLTLNGTTGTIAAGVDTSETQDASAKTCAIEISNTNSMINWNNIGLSITTSGSDVANAIQGLSYDTTAKTVSVAAGYNISVVDKYKLTWDSSGILKLEPLT